MSEDRTPGFWQVRFPLPADAVDEVLAAVEDDALSLAAFEDEDGFWVCEILSREPPDKAALQRRLALALGEQAPPAATIAVERLAARDWLEATRRSFPPRAIGRFWVYGSHVEEPAPAGAVPLLIDAGTAFGSGEHGSTMGCLMAVDALARKHRFHRVLDMGCGSAILAIAALKCWPTGRAVACDIDPGSVTTAADNAALNGVGPRLRAFVADGYDRPALRREGRFDLVLANILAGPLIEMAPDLAKALAPGGHAVLSGMLTVQSDAVLHAHRHQGLVAVERIDVGPWTTLVLRRPAWRARPMRVRHPSPFAVERWPVPSG